MKTPFDLTGQTAIITGGGTGLGQQFASTLASSGARVILCARRLEKLEQAAQAIRDDGGEAHCIPMDVSVASSVDKAFEQIASLGTASIVVNNAGAASKPQLLDMTEAEWDSVLDTNLKGSWLVAQRAAKLMIANRTGGSVINIASVLASCVQKHTGSYAAAKAGVVHLTRAMALEWARYGIRVNAIAPGYFHTDLSKGYLDSEAGQVLLKRIPQRRLGEPAELDGALLLLASEASRYMTGSVVTVDGGLSMSII